MQLTKFSHACVLAELDDTAVLFDPGIYSWKSGLVDTAKFPELTAVIISHKHADHCAEPFVRALAERFPDITWFAPDDAHEELHAWGVRNVQNASRGNVSVQQAPHSKVEPFGVPVQNLITHIAGVLTHPGDTHDITETKDVLLLPVQAPWGTTIRAVELALELKPKYILPIHDWMWNDEWRNVCYDRFEQIFRSAGIEFLRPENGQPIRVSLWNCYSLQFASEAVQCRLV